MAKISLEQNNKKLEELVLKRTKAMISNAAKWVFDKIVIVVPSIKHDELNQI